MQFQMVAGPMICYLSVMVEEPESLTLVYLRRLDAKVDRLGVDMIEVKDRLTALEQGQVAIWRVLTDHAEADARLQVQVDRISGRLDRIERRLDIAEN